ncbi:hypothetical protein MGAST_12445 [Mycobacterium gastri 'Wayne']|nr:hypothetical protein MGAST_12445 [Mycobacterium gastri 'Wayne']
MILTVIEGVAALAVQFDADMAVESFPAGRGRYHRHDGFTSFFPSAGERDLKSESVLHR